MADKSPFMWMPKDIVELVNASGGNLLLDLPSGMLRLDKDRSTRITASALDAPQVKALLDEGKLTVNRGGKRRS